MPFRRELSQAEVVQAAVEDARAQDELRVSMLEAAAFICQIASRARALDEYLPLRYFVREVENVLYLMRTVSVWVAQTEDNSTEGSDSYSKEEEIYVASYKDSQTTLFEVERFAKDLNTGLIPKIGRYFIKRARRNRHRAQTAQHAVKDVAQYRALLEDDNW